VNPRTLRCSILAAALAGAAFGGPGGAAARPIVSEVLYDAAGSDDGAVFVELFGAPGDSLEGLSLEGVNGAGGAVTVTIALSGAIPDDGIFVLADLTAAGATSVPGADLLANFDLQNGPDSLLLRSGSEVLDRLGYGAFAAGAVFAGEGSPAPDAPAGSSLARRFADLDTGDNAADFVVLASPTPGSAPVRSVPEPGAAGLLGAGLLAWLGTRRRPARPGGPPGAPVASLAELRERRRSGAPWRARG